MAKKRNVPRAVVDDDVIVLDSRAPRTVAPTPTPAVTPTPSIADDPYYKRDPKTGLSPAQVEARAGLVEAAAQAAQLGIETKVVTPTKSAGRIVPKPEVPPADANFTYDYVWVGGTTGGSIGDWKLIKTAKTGSGSSNTNSNTPSGSNVPSGIDPATQAIIDDLKKQVASLSATQTQANINAAAEKAAADKARAENAISVLTSRFAQYNLQSLVPKIRDLAIGGATEATITLQLQETPEYKQRFRANQDRINKGLAVLDPGDYIRLEDKYRQILRAYGLSRFDNDAYVSQFLSNDVSTDEVASRVQLAVQRVQNADPAVLNTLTRYYGIGNTDLVAYALDPDTQFQKIERQVAAAEVGAAAGLQGIQTGVAVAEQLAAQGISQAEARKGYATIADILPDATRLSGIYSGTLEGYGLAEAEQEVFNQLASAQRKRERLAQREVAAFTGSSGMGRTSLSAQIGGAF